MRRLTPQQKLRVARALLSMSLGDETMPPDRVRKFAYGLIALARSQNRWAMAQAQAAERSAVEITPWIVHEESCFER